MPMAAGFEGFPFIPSFQAEAFARARAEEAAADVKAGCGSKRKAEEDGGEVTVKAKAAEEAALTLKAKAKEVNKVVVANPMWQEVEDSDCDSEEDAKAFLARIRAEFNAHAEKLKADNPWLEWADYDPEEYSADGYFSCKQEEDASNGGGVVDDRLVPV